MLKFKFHNFIIPQLYSITNTNTQSMWWNLSISFFNKSKAIKLCFFHLQELELAELPKLSVPDEPWLITPEPLPRPKTFVFVFSKEFKLVPLFVRRLLPVFIFPLDSFCVLYRMKYTSGLLGGVGAAVGIVKSADKSSGFLTNTYTMVFSWFWAAKDICCWLGADTEGALMKIIL